MQATFDSQFNTSTFYTLLRPKAGAQENECKRQSAIIEQNAKMGLAEAIVQDLPEEVEFKPPPKTPVQLLTEDCEMLRKGVETMTASMVASTQGVMCDSTSSTHKPGTPAQLAGHLPPN
jgi:hypothetical protein